jgi:hypothetical protein
MIETFRFLMISAMYENGGNTTQRFLDGHPEMYVYPFESQVGTNLVRDHLSATFPVKYRWPVFALDATPEEDYFAIIDEECKVRARTPRVSKFNHAPFDFSDDERLELFVKHVAENGRSRAENIAAFFTATFEAWRDYQRSGLERFYVGYSPIVVIDTEKILDDLPEAHVLHIVRNPWSAFADTKKRPVPLSLANYMLGWTINQYHALLFAEKFPDRVSVVTIESVMEDPVAALGSICSKLGVESSASLGTPSFNGTELEEVYPWGTIRKASPEVNLATAQELSAEEREEIRRRTWQYLNVFGYTDFV